MKPSLWIKYPDPRQNRRSYSIVRRGEDGSTITIPDSRIDVINHMVRAGKLDHERATLDVRTILKELQDREVPDEHRPTSVNVEVAENCWRDVYEGREGRNDPDSQRSLRQAFARAVKALGPVPVTTARLGDLQKAVTRTKPRGQRSIVLALNAMLRYLGRKERVGRRLGAPVNPRHVVAEEMGTLLAALPSDEHRLVVSVAFGTGCRLGEVFGLERLTLSGSVWVGRQLKKIDDRWTFWSTKNKKERSAVVIPEYLDAVRRWLSVPQANRERLREEDWSTIVQTAARASLGRPLTFHDLRHSYAIHWVQLDVPLKKVANQLGNSLVVTDKYYSSYQTTSSDETAMLALARKKAG